MILYAQVKKIKVKMHGLQMYFSSISTKSLNEKDKWGYEFEALNNWLMIQYKVNRGDSFNCSHLVHSFPRTITLMLY